MGTRLYYLALHATPKHDQIRKRASRIHLPDYQLCATVWSSQISAMLSTLRGEKKTVEGNWRCSGGGSAHSVSIISGDPSFWSQPPSFSRKCGNETIAILLGRPNLVSQSQTLSHTISKWESGFMRLDPNLVLQARLSLGRRECGQIPIRLLYCILSSRVPNEVGVSINWNVFLQGRSSVITPKTHRSLNNIETRWWWEFDQALSPRESLAPETRPNQFQRGVGHWISAYTASAHADYNSWVAR